MESRPTRYCVASLYIMLISQLGLHAAETVPVRSHEESESVDGPSTRTIAQAQADQKAGRFAEAQTLLEATLNQTNLTSTEQRQLSDTLADLHRVWGDDLKKRYAYEEAIAHYEAAFASDQHERRKEAAATLTAIGEAYSELSRYDTARSYYEWALILQREIGDRTGESVTLSRLGRAYNDADHYEKAIEVLEQALPLLHEAQNRKEESKAFRYLGDTYIDLGQYDQAQTHYENALTIAQESSNREEEADALTGLGAVSRLRGEYAASLTFLNQALAIRRDLGDSKGEAQTLNHLGNTFSVTNPPKAVDYYEQALPIARKVQDRDLESTLVGNLGLSYRALGQYDKAIEHMTLALTFNREFRRRLGEGIALNNLGHVYQSLSQYDTAIAHYEQALAIVREVKSRAYEGYVLNNLGQVYNDLSQYEKAISYYQQSLVISRETKQRNGEAVTLNNVGTAYVHLSQYDKAIEQFEQVLVIVREIGNRPVEGTVLANLGYGHLSIGRPEQAISYFEQALVIARDLKSRHQESIVLNNLVTAYYSVSEYRKAVEYGQQALVIKRELKDRHGEAKTLGNLGSAYFTLGQYEQARSHFEQAVAILHEIKARDAEGTMLYNLAVLYLKLGQPDRSRQHVEQALAIAREVGNRMGEAQNLNGLGSMYAVMDMPEKALAVQEQALAIARETHSRQLEGIILNNLGVRNLELAQYEKAGAYVEQGLTILREVQNKGQEAVALGNLMGTWRKRGAPQLAIFYGKQAVNTYQEIRANIRGLENELQQSFLKSKEDTYRALADLLIAEGRLPEAEQVLRFLKQEELYEFVRRDAKAVDAVARVALTKTEEQWARRYLEIADRLTALGQEFAALQAKQQKVSQLSPAETERLLTLDSDLQVARQAMAAFLKELAVALNDSQEAGKRLANVETSKNLQDTLRMLGAGTVAVYTIVGKEKSWLMLVAPEVQKAYEVPIAAPELNRKALAFRHALQTPSLDPRPLGKELYDLFLQPLASDLEALHAQTVMWSLDGVLRYIPIGALYDGKQYVVERYRTTVFTLAGQSFLTTIPQGRWQAAGLGVSKEQTGFVALPEVPSELRAIIRAGKTAGGVLPGTIQLDADFTLRALQLALARRMPVVHLASHFHFQPGNDTESFLLLGDGARLSIAELMRFSFSGIELLTLSACATALGSEGTGKEVESFAALAQKSGAQAVVASLWPVADTSTRELMQQFYRNRESKKGMSKAEALRQAQLALLRGQHKTLDREQQSRGVVHVSHDSTGADGKANAAPPFSKDPAAPYAHPYYWAPFILIGNWR